MTLSETQLPTPIFICGCPRSGSTLLARVLNGLTGCIALPEGRFIVEAARISAQVRLTDAEIERIRSAIRNHWQFRAWQIPLTAAGGPFDASTLSGFMGNFVCEFAGAQGRAKDRLQYFVDQYPDNIRFVPHLLRHFPTAKFIHLVRDGRAVAASVKHLDWGPNTALRAAMWWKRYDSAGAAMDALIAPENLHKLKYETLVEDEASVVASLARFLGLPDHAPARHTPLPLPEYTLSQHDLVNKALDRSRIDAWRRHLSQREIRVFESIAGAYLQRLGYELVFPEVRSPPGRFELLVTSAYDEIMRRRNRILYRHRRSIGAFDRLG